MKKLWLFLPFTLLSGCADNWGWYVVNPTTTSGYNNLWFLLSGLYYTVLLSFTAILISIVVGLLVALPGLSDNKFLRGFNRVYVEFVRAIPILVLILWVYYGLPQLASISIGVFWAGVMRLRSPTVHLKRKFSVPVYSRLIRANTRLPTPYR